MYKGKVNKVKSKAKQAKATRKDTHTVRDVAPGRRWARGGA